MSRIFDAIKHVQHNKHPGPEKLAVPPKAERRRCPRWSAHVPVSVSGHSADHQPFREEAHSAVVSELGGLLVMTASVHPGDRLHLTNKVTQLQQECRIAHVSGSDPGTIEVAVEFAQLAPDFWQVPQVSADSSLAVASKLKFTPSRLPAGSTCVHELGSSGRHDCHSRIIFCCKRSREENDLSLLWYPQAH